MSNMTLEFINKRINEQLSEIVSINERFKSKQIDTSRFNELSLSAKSQYEYFLEKEKLYLN